MGSPPSARSPVALPHPPSVPPSHWEALLCGRQDELLGEAAGLQQRQDERREAGARADSSGGTRPLWLLQGLRLPAPLPPTHPFRHACCSCWSLRGCAGPVSGPAASAAVLGANPSRRTGRCPVRPQSYRLLMPSALQTPAVSLSSLPPGSRFWPYIEVEEPAALAAGTSLWGALVQRCPAKADGRWGGRHGLPLRDAGRGEDRVLLSPHPRSHAFC